MPYTMNDERILILSTRAIDGALIEKAAYNNITIDTISFIEIKSLVSDEVKKRIELLSKEKITVVFTSMNGLETVIEWVSASPEMPDWKIYCLGGATFTLVKKYWPYQNVAFTAKNATELAQRIATDQLESVVFFCGNKRREELPVFLAQRGIRVEELVVYETIETPAKVERSYNGILFFSPSAVHSYFSENQPDHTAVFFALGNTTAASIKQFATNKVIVSDFPAKDQLVDSAIKYFNEFRAGERQGGGDNSLV
jgi:uroporphyrinogen-III synthase